MTALAATLLIAGCGGQRQDANEPRGIFHVKVPVAIFPAKQRLGTQRAMFIAVRNIDTRTIPNVAVTIDSFDYRSTQPNLAGPLRPVWIVDEGPYGGVTAYVSTWALGRLLPGRTAIFRWLLTPVKAGDYHVSYRVAAGLNGKAVALLADGSAPQGSFDVHIPSAPPLAAVVPRTGHVVTTPQSVPQPVPQVQPNTSTPPPIGPNEPTTPYATSTTGGY